MNILVTGSNGQLGNEMVRVSGKSKERYVFTDIAELDITKLDAVLSLVRKEQIDVIVNCAAYTNVDKAEDDEKTADLINHVAVGYLAAAAKSVNATLIHISTDYVFRGINYVPFTEEDMTEPTGVYGKTKLAGEEAVVNSGCNYIILRTAWLYSAWGKNFVKTMLKLTEEKDILPVIFDQIGTPTLFGFGQNEVPRDVRLQDSALDGIVGKMYQPDKSTEQWDLNGIYLLRVAQASSAAMWCACL